MDDPSDRNWVRKFVPALEGWEEENDWGNYDLSDFDLVNVKTIS